MAKRKVQQGLSSETFQQLCRIAAIGAALVLATIILTTPELDGNRDELLMLVLTLVLALAGGYRRRSSGSKDQESDLLLPGEFRMLLQDLLREWMDRNQPQSQPEADQTPVIEEKGKLDV